MVPWTHHAFTEFHNSYENDLSHIILALLESNPMTKHNRFFSLTPAGNDGYARRINPFMNVEFHVLNDGPYLLDIILVVNYRLRAKAHNTNTISIAVELVPNYQYL